MNEPQSRAAAPIPQQTLIQWAGRFAAGTTPSIHGRVRLRTLSNLRWLAVSGQSAALFVVYFGLGYQLPLLRCAAAIAMSAMLNIALALRYPASHRLANREATMHLAYDVLQLAALLYLTGGIENPFALMFIAPVVIGATTLNLGNTLILAALAFVSVCTISVFHMPLPWAAHETLTLPVLYKGGIWASIVIGIGFTSIYAWRIASEAARMQAGLAATQLALAREHRMAAIGALAAAAAHELGTPLGTIAVVSRELERSLPPGSSESEDAKLLRQEAERCRKILTQLSRPEESVLGATERLPVGALLDDIASKYRSEKIAITVDCDSRSEGPQPKVWRAPEVLHSFENIIANACDFAKSKVSIRCQWDERRLRVSVEDDGPGFAPEILERIGEPYVTSRPGYFAVGESEIGPTDKFAAEEGMGLGFFIAKTLIEQTGGTLRVFNVQDGGAHLRVSWPRGAVDGEARPGAVTRI